MSRTLAHPLLAAAALALCFPASAVASGAPSPDEIAGFHVLPGWRTAEGTHMAALQVTLAPGWKTYWRAPGDAGIPPQFDWRRSRNLAAVQIHWPVPEVFHQNGMRAIGYSGQVVLPIELTPRSGGPITLSGELELGVCQDICIPMSVQFASDIPAVGAGDALIESALRARPETAHEAGVATVRCDVEPIADGLRISARIEMPALGGDEVAVFELPDHTIWIAEASATRHGGVLEAVTEMVPPQSRPFMLQRSDVRITVIGGETAVDIRGCGTR